MYLCVQRMYSHYVSLCIEITFSPKIIAEKLAEMIHCQNIKLRF